MRILKDVIEKMNDTLEEIEWYSTKAHHLRAEHRALADTYIKIAEQHVGIYNNLHERAVALINEQKGKGVEVPASMQAIWDYEHEKLIQEFGEIKYLIEEYKKMGY